MIRDKRIILAAGAGLFVIALAIGIVCGRSTAARQQAQRNEYEQALIGKWAYLHDLKKAAAVFRPDGSAKFEGGKYDYSCDGRQICFTDKSGEVQALRYVQDNDSLCLYIRSKYVPEDGSVPEGLVGVWTCREKNWTYEFTEKGTFMEDGILTGHYFVDEENGTVRLVYEEVLEDTVFYYQLTDEGLFIEYPWMMARM